jgi:hypothetical protein
MKLRLAALGALAVAIAGLAPTVAPAQAAPKKTFNIASENYYRLDVPGGTVAARVEARVRAADSKELKSVFLFAMPGAKDIVVKQDEVTLETRSEVLSDEAGLPTVVTATLATPIKGVMETKLTMTYTVGALRTELVTIQAGSIEALFPTQGPGSFVLIDVPKSGDNVFEPGCFVTNEQPADVVESGFERWMCGETLAAAVHGDDQSVKERCARLDDACRQRRLGGVFVGFAQSTTDPAKKGRLEEVIMLPSGPRTLTLLYFRESEAWAKAQFEAARRALPALEGAFGFPYPHERVLLRESNLIGSVGFAGLAFTNTGEMLLFRIPPDAGLDAREVTTHELAHQWAGLNLEASWLWEGLAEYGQRLAASDVGYTPDESRWREHKYKDVLSLWFNGSEVYNPEYWYGKAGSFWFEYEKALGGREYMRKVLSIMNDNPARLPLDGRWFMDRGEEVSNANLDALFLEWVWVKETATPLLKERRAAREQAVTLYQRAESIRILGMPPEIQNALDEWEFAPVAELVKLGNEVLDAYLSAAEYAGQQNLSVNVTAMGKVWASAPLKTTKAYVADMRAAVDAIVRGEEVAGGEPPESPSHKAVADARAKFAEGDFTTVKSLSAGTVTADFNRDAAIKLLALAKETQDGWKPSFFETIGLYQEDPEGDLKKAEQAFADGDYAKAIKLAREVQETYNGAQNAGYLRLAIMAGLLTMFATGGWWLVKRYDDRRQAKDEAARPKRRQGHALNEPGERRGSWQDFLNEK